MSGIFVVAPMMLAAPIVATAASAVAASLGFTLLSQNIQGKSKLEATTHNRVQFDIQNAQGITDLIKQKGGLELRRDDCTIRFYSGKGRCQMEVLGEAQESVLQELGQQVIDKLVQQYAYHRVMTDMEQRGFGSVEEQIEEDGTIRLHLRRWD